MGKFQDLTGQVFGELTVVERAPDYVLPCGKHQVMWKCKCSCGNDFITRALQLKNGDSKSCGHLQKETVSKMMRDRMNFVNQWDLSEEFGIGHDNSGNEFYFDLEDFDKIKNYYWFVDSSSEYVQTHTDNGILFLHRLVMNVLDRNWKEVQVDHIGGNKSRFDNRKSNLRYATVSQNGMNKGLQSNNTSGVSGVSLHKQSGKWRARIKINGKEIHLGLFDTFEEAVEARRKAEERYFGEFSYNNSQKFSKQKE